MSKLAKDSAIIALTPTADQTGSRGYFVENSSGSAAIVNAVTDIPLGVIVDGGLTSGKSAIAIGGSGLVVKVKVGGTPGTINPGTYLTTKNDGTVIADAGSGDRCRVARALEDGAATELIDAVLIDPLFIGA